MPGWLRWCSLMRDDEGGACGLGPSPGDGGMPSQGPTVLPVLACGRSVWVQHYDRECCTRH